MRSWTLRRTKMHKKAKSQNPPWPRSFWWFVLILDAFRFEFEASDAEIRKLSSRREQTRQIRSLKTPKGLQRKKGSRFSMRKVLLDVYDVLAMFLTDMMSSLPIAWNKRFRLGIFTFGNKENVASEMCHWFSLETVRGTTGSRWKNWLTLPLVN